MARLGDAVSAVDEVHGFRYFDDRDLLASSTAPRILAARQ